MRDRYVGDIGDYGKYGLLREIYNQANGNITIGINWYYVDIDKGVEYLKREKDFRVYFPEIFDKLKEIVQKRTIKEIMEISKKDGSILPENTIFYSEPLNKRRREEWFMKSLDVLENADIIFLDPDNGIQKENMKKTNKDSIKYAFYDEIKAYFDRGKTVIVYNHYDRSPLDEYKKRIEKLKDVGGRLEVLKFKRYFIRHYVFLIQKKHENLMEKAINSLVNRCGFLFEKGF